jgi:chromosome segregation and condensation protein ScpB
MAPAGPPSLDPARILDAAARLDLAVDPNGLAASLKACAGEGDPFSAAAKAATLTFSALPDAPAPLSEIFSLWAFDITLAIRLRWPRPVPLIATKILDPTLRSQSAGRRLRPGESGWPNAAAGAIALAAASALDLAADLSRRSKTLIAVAPQLRSKPAQKIVDLMLAQDCVSATEAARHAPMTGRAARRLFDRLVAFGAAREFFRAAHVSALRPMTAAARRRQRGRDESLGVELAELPLAARWREWMLRVEAAIFASARPVPREALVRLVGEACRFDDLIADPIHELRGRPYDLTLVAGGYALRTKTRFAPAIRAAHPGLGGDDVAELTRTETFALTAIAYLQPVTRGEISKLAGREISRDIIAAKMPANRAQTTTSLYAAYSKYLVVVALKGAQSLPKAEIPTDPAVMHRRILETYKTVDLKSALHTAWDLGVVVLPLRDRGTFHGACWRYGGRNTVVLKQTSKHEARWLFDLLHELFHAGQRPEADTLEVIEADETSAERRNSDEEIAASQFAGEVVLNGEAETSAQECVRAARKSVERLNDALVL